MVAGVGERRRVKREISKPMELYHEKYKLKKNANTARPRGSVVREGRAVFITM